MKWRVRISVALFGAAFVQPQSATLRLADTIAMPTVEGRIDHLAIDVEGQRLFVAALGNNTLEVFDVRANRAIKSVGGFHEPQGIRYLPESRRVVVANGADGMTTFLDGATLVVTKTVKLSGDADNVRYDANAGRVYVGYGSGALSILDPDGKALGDVKLAARVCS